MSDMLDYLKVYRQEFDQAKRFVEAVKDNTANYFFLNFFALDGFAKTTFLKHLWEEYEGHLPASFRTIKDFLRNKESFDLSDLLIKIIEQIDERLPKRIAILPPDYQSLPDEALAEWLVKLISKATEAKNTCVLFFDDYDLMPSQTRSWFEEKIFSQLVRTKKVVVILTSQSEIKFKDRIDLRMRLESHELPGLSVEDISASFPQYGASAAKIYQFTGGLPTLTGKLIQQLDDAPAATETDNRFQEKVWIKKYYQPLINDLIIHNIPDELQETVLVLSLLRRFDVAVLREMLPQIMRPKYQAYRTVDYLDLIESLGNLLQWRTQGGYALNDAFRVALHGYVFIDNPGLYKKVHRAAAELYRQSLKQEYRQHYLVELLYHEASLLRAEKGSDIYGIQKKIELEVQQYLNGDTLTRIQETDLDGLRQSLKHDPDLKDYVSEETLNAIETLIHAKINENRVIDLKRTA